MFVIRIIIEFYILFHKIAQIQTLVQLPIIENNNIAIAETVIRNTVNDLFAAFKIPGIKNRTRIKQFSTIHNFFVSITLTDCDNLKKIARLSTVNNIDNGTQHFIAQINEVLNEGDKNAVATEDENHIYVATYIEKFIKKLKHLKDTYVSYTNTVIKSDILKYLVHDKKTLINITKDNMNSSEINEQSQDEDKVVYDEFWHPDSRRLYKGIRTTIKRYPFMASIHFFQKFQCAGSIIKNDLVITSSSCLQIAWNNRFFRENPAFLSIRIGCDYYDLCGDNIAILSIYFHPQYEPKTLKHNLAIMRMKRKINFRFSHGRVKKINFDKNPWELPVNSRITAIGWGAKDATNFVNDVHKNKLSYAELEYFPLEDCQNYYSKDFVSHYNFCAGFFTKGGGACSHDAGGPGIQNSLLMGVISFGSPICGAPDVPTVFTKLGFYADWIEDIVEKEHPSGYIGTTVTQLKPSYIFTRQRTTEKLKITPFGDTTISPDIRNEINVLRIPQEQAFQDFLSTMFESKEIKAYVDTSDAEIENKLGKQQSSDLKVEQTTVTTRKDRDTYITSEIKHTTENTDNSKSISVEIDSPEDSNVKDVEGMSIESTTGSLKEVTIENYSNEVKVSEKNITRMLKSEEIKDTETKNQIVPGHTYNSTTTKNKTKENTGDLNLTPVKAIDSSEDLIGKDKTEEMSIETVTESLNDTLSTNVTDYDKILEENIKIFMDNLDLKEYLVPQTTLSEINKTNTKQELELNKTLSEGEISTNQRSILNSLFFSDENTDDTDNEKGLSII